MTQTTNQHTMNPTDAASMIDKELEAQTPPYSLLNWRMWCFRAIWFLSGFISCWRLHHD